MRGYTMSIRLWLAFFVLAPLTFVEVLCCCLRPHNNCCLSCSSGSILQQKRDVADFKKIDASAVGELVIEHVLEPYVIVEGNEDVVGDVETSVHNGILAITAKESLCCAKKRKLKVTVGVGDLHELSVDGVGNVIIKKIETKAFKLAANGVGLFHITTLNVDHFDAAMDGVGTIKIDGGVADEQNIGLNGCGSFESRNLSGLRGKVSGLGCGSVC